MRTVFFHRGQCVQVAVRFCVALLFVLYPANIVFAEEVAADVAQQEEVQEVPPTVKLEASADSAGSIPIHGGDAHYDDERNSIGSQATDQPDSIAGSLTLSYPLAVPPGRGKMTPTLSLNYSSQPGSDTGVVGYGWGFSVPSIQRLNKTGIENLYTQDAFYSAVDGELVSIGGTSYRALVDGGSFNQYTYTPATGWVMKDKSGLTYTFGQSAASRQDDPSDASRVYKWMLSEIRDQNNNYIQFSYYKDGGQIYPNAILYTGNGASPGIFEINFLRETRSDVFTSYDPGFSVTSNYRIKEVVTKVRGVWVKKYTLAYGVGDNQSRSLLQSLTEHGQDDAGNVITLPSTVFSYQRSIGGWTPITTGLVSPAFLVDYQATINGDSGLRLVDVNGDGLVDIFAAITTAGGQSRTTLLNTGSGFITSATWLPPVDATDVTQESYGGDVGVRLVDVNGDALPDIVQSYRNSSKNNTTTRTFLNTGAGWELSTSLWQSPLFIADYSVTRSGDTGVRFMDINADGLVDMVQSGVYLSEAPSHVVYINTGYGWELATSSLWALPVSFVDYKRADIGDTGVRVADVNGDNLPDILQGLNGTYNSWINTGSDWVLDSAWDVPASFLVQDRSHGLEFLDVNNDGLPDVVAGYRDASGSSLCTWINTGHGWRPEPSWIPPAPLIDLLQHASGDMGLRFTDMDGNGSVDITQGVRFTSGGSSVQTLINNTPKPDLLMSATNTTGGKKTFVYQATPLYKDSTGLLNPHLPVVLNTLKSSTIEDGLGGVNTTTYTYAEGAYYYETPHDHKLAGFGKITITDALGNYTTTFYHTANRTDTAHGEYNDSKAKIGKVYRTEQRDAEGALYAKSITKWDQSPVFGDAYFVKPAQTVTSAYDGQTTHTDKAESYNYSAATGNLTKKTLWGQVFGNDDGSYVDTGADAFTVTYSYASKPASPLTFVADETTTNQNLEKISQTRHFYDNLELGDLDRGNETRTKYWVNGSSFVNTEKAYDVYGMAIQLKDARGKITTNTFDTDNLYVATTTNPLNQKTGYTYDYASGKILNTYDSNNRLYTTKYDALRRPVLVSIPDPNTGVSVVKTTYTYADSDIPGNTNVLQTDVSGSNISNSLITYVDGLGRTIQTRKTAEGPDKYIASDSVYNNVGLLQQQSLPYFSSGLMRTPATSVGELLTSYIYDPLQRPVRIKTAVGDTLTTYSGWKTTATDPSGNTKELLNDAYGNLITVIERDAQGPLMTTYMWDGNKNLTKITDALGNVRNFTYDGLSRRLSAEDLHTPDDTTFGVWKYTYDLGGNLIKKTDPKSQITNYTYDDTNRVLSEDYTGASGVELSYTYDSCFNGVGRLCGVVGQQNSASDYTYNVLGLLATSSKTIANQTYDTGYTYDRLGNTMLIVHPDNTQTRYSYNNAGLAESIEGKSPRGQFKTLVSNVDYSPLGQPSTINYGNITTTVNVYDANALYRLSTKKTTDNNGLKLQDLSYTYDPVGNITRLADVSQTPTAKTVDYTYDPLYRLTTASTSNTTSTGYRAAYSYDAIGNITASFGQGNYAYAGTNYANPHAATQITNASTTVSLGYDANGNTTSLGSWTYKWDYRNRLLQASSGLATSTYRYDENNIRVLSNDNNGKQTHYADKYHTKLVGSATTTINVFLGDILVATMENRGTLSLPTYVYTDHLGSTQITAAQNGTIKEVLDYYPYGAVALDQGASTVAREFIGQYFDEQPGLSYLNARYYNGSRGQFISQDPEFWVVSESWLFDPQNQNAYGYGKNNPITLSDPTGRSAFGIIIQNIKNIWNNVWNSNRATYQAPTIPTINQAPEVNTPKTITWDPITDRKIQQLDPRLRQPATNFINNTESELNTQLRISQSYRSIEEQNKLYSQGRTIPGDIITKAKGGESYHNYNLAFDVVRVENGKENWKTPINQEIANIAIKQGFEWGGNWSGFKDYPHFQMTFGQSIKTLMSGPKK